MKLLAPPRARGAAGSFAPLMIVVFAVGAALLLYVTARRQPEAPVVGAGQAVDSGQSPAVATTGAPAATQPAALPAEVPAETQEVETQEAVVLPAPASPPQETGAAPFKEVWPPQGHDDDPSQLDSFGTSHLPVCGEGWYTNNIAKGEAEARKLGKPLLLIFEKERCKHCRHFNNVQLADPEFAALVKSGQMVVVKRYFDQWDKQNHNIRATPTFKAMEWRNNDWVMTEYLPGLLEVPLMKKRIRDVAAGRGRLDRQRKAMAADPADPEPLKVLLDEYLEIFPERQQIDMVNKALELEPDWTHGIAMKIFILTSLEKQGMPSAKPMVEEFVGAAQARLTKGAGGALDWFTVGYYELSTQQHEPGVRKLERSLELNKKDCEVLGHLSYGYVSLAGLAKLQKESDDVVRDYLIKGETMANRAVGYCPENVLANTRKTWIEQQWQALGLSRQGGADR